jgi:hypothetical protein
VREVIAARTHDELIRGYHKALACTGLLTVVGSLVRIWFYCKVLGCADIDVDDSAVETLLFV